MNPLRGIWECVGTQRPGNTNDNVTAQARQWVRMRDLGIPMTPIGLVRRISENYRASYGGESGSEPIRRPFG
ncbi:uncharacterized protein BDR25DRAFT_353732 [Lindgomyces ingoldianus]|uniref:Uncharacterized protein n=1 Tax=Lindgomyces ingoldianus TaxID=673940 RepID=A0ACB6R0I9_9PLEO|nr:uncharacterized protein BDR25DRAFT_353732 [Lindgomyces ingoldianus]KAF2471966.1 hypothetical protein BDR25DRAFT_353732 [Lindgomyces ingoldianus]